MQQWSNCPKCFAAVASNSKFCSNCGLPQQQPHSTPYKQPKQTLRSLRKKLQLKRRWWIWLLAALFCWIVGFVFMKLTGDTTKNDIFGWGALGLMYGIPLTFGLLMFSVLFVWFVGGLLRLILGSFVSDRGIVALVLFSLGFLSIFFGLVLVIRAFEWSFWLIITGFSMGCAAGAEYQRCNDLREKND